MANYIATDTALIATASAIRSKRGITSSITFNATKGFADAISLIPTANVTNTTATAADVFNNAYFYTSNGVRTKGTFPSGVVLPAEDYTSIPENCYAYTASIRYVTFSNCTTIGNGAFNNCTSLTSVNFPACVTINYSAFRSCKSLTSLTSAFFPACTTTGSNVFRDCTSLTSVNLPACITLGMNVFSNCTSLTSVNLPACTTIRTGAFMFCSSLTSLSFPACTTINANAFYGCSSLSVIYLANNSVVTLAYTTAFNKTKITETTGSIRVPSNLVDSYKTATNWTKFSNRIFAI